MIKQIMVSFKKVAAWLDQSDRFFLIPILTSLLSVLLIIGHLAILYPQLPKRLPLFYSLPWGESQLISKESFLLLPAIIITVSLINYLLAALLHPIHLVLRRILTLSLLLVNLIILITVIKIIFIFL